MAAKQRQGPDIRLDARAPATIGPSDDQDAGDAHALYLRSVDAGCRVSASPIRVGRSINSPPQLGQRSSNASAQGAQRLHSKEQMNAPGSSAGRSTPQRRSEEHTSELQS